MPGPAADPVITCPEDVIGASAERLLMGIGGIGEGDREAGGSKAVGVLVDHLVAPKGDAAEVAEEEKDPGRGHGQQPLESRTCGEENAGILVGQRDGVGFRVHVPCAADENPNGIHKRGPCTRRNHKG